MCLVEKCLCYVTIFLVNFRTSTYVVQLDMWYVVPWYSYMLPTTHFIDSGSLMYTMSTGPCWMTPTKGGVCPAMPNPGMMMLCIVPSYHVSPFDKRDFVRTGRLVVAELLLRNRASTAL